MKIIGEKLPAEKGYNYQEMTYLYCLTKDPHKIFYYEWIEDIGGFTSKGVVDELIQVKLTLNKRSISKIALSLLCNAIQHNQYVIGCKKILIITSNVDRMTKDEAAKKIYESMKYWINYATTDKKKSHEARVAKYDKKKLSTYKDLIFSKMYIEELTPATLKQLSLSNLRKFVDTHLKYSIPSNVLYNALISYIVHNDVLKYNLLKIEKKAIEKFDVELDKKVKRSNIKIDIANSLQREIIQLNHVFSDVKKIETEYVKLLVTEIVLDKLKDFEEDSRIYELYQEGVNSYSMLGFTKLNLPFDIYKRTINKQLKGNLIKKRFNNISSKKIISNGVYIGLTKEQENRPEIMGGIKDEISWKL